MPACPAADAMVLVLTTRHFMSTIFLQSPNLVFSEAIVSRSPVSEDPKFGLSPLSQGDQPHCKCKVGSTGRTDGGAIVVVVFVTVVRSNIPKREKKFHFPYCKQLLLIRPDKFTFPLQINKLIYIHFAFTA